uniref:Uncharacterized protein n=1 Tax=Mastacembelus armatus TaxID=205130 RepID=A0A3Q3NDU2_9TELE
TSTEPHYLSLLLGSGPHRYNKTSTLGVHMNRLQQFAGGEVTGRWIGFTVNLCVFIC